MSTNWQADIELMHDEIPHTRHQEGKQYPHVPSLQKREMWHNFIMEELSETFEALDSGNVVDAADGIGDTLVVIIGLAMSCGIQIQPIWDEIYRSNMTKKGGNIREDGKFMKPLSYEKPNLKPILISQGMEDM